MFCEHSLCSLGLAHTKPLAIRSWFWPSSSECPAKSVLGEQVLRYLFRLCLAALLPQLSDGFKKKLLTCRLASIYVYCKERSDAFPSFLHPKGKLEAFLVLHWSLDLSFLVHLFVTFLCLCVWIRSFPHEVGRIYSPFQKSWMLNFFSLISSFHSKKLV